MGGPWPCHVPDARPADDPARPADLHRDDLETLRDAAARTGLFTTFPSSNGSSGPVALRRRQPRWSKGRNHRR
jgi:hypothetical protein